MFKVMIVDDEKPAIKKLAHQLETLDDFDIDICATYCSAVEAMQNLERSECNLVFLDIEMPGINGIETAESILEKKPEMDIVFVTAYEKYALEAFDVNAVDYLLKPVVKDRLLKTLTRVQRRRKVIGQKESKQTDYLIKTFGGIDIMKNGVSVNISWRSAKVRELFGYYIHHRNSKLHRNKILDDLWSDMEYERALSNFNTCNYQLRKQLAETGSGITVTFAGGCYALDLCSSTCDIDLIERHLSKKQLLNQTEVDLMTNAMKLYRGLYCDHISGFWVNSRRYYYENLYVNAAVLVAKYYYEHRQYGECLEYAQKAVEANKLFEEGWIILLNVLKIRGDMDEYNVKYKNMKQIFEKELGETLTI